MNLIQCSVPSSNSFFSIQEAARNAMADMTVLGLPEIGPGKTLASTIRMFGIPDNLQLKV